MILAIITGLPLAFAVVVGLVGARLPRQVWTVISTMLMAGLFGWLLTMLPEVTAAGAIVTEIPWVPAIGLSLTFYLDGLSLLFGVLVTGIGVAVAWYTGHYFDDDQQAVRFYAMLFAFAAAMLAVVFAGNLIMLFIAWELTSVTSFMLIGFKGNKSESARAGAMQALIVTGAGGLALIAGLVLVGAASGSYEMVDVLNTNLADHPWYIAATILVLLGAFTKSAQWPFHFWLPGAMAAPSPASAYLHSATMVKAGVYLVARLYPTLGNAALWTTTLTVVGLATLLFSSLLAIRQRDMKGLLAYTTIGQLGALVALIGLPDANGIKAAMVGILAHALYKAPMFLIAGIVDHATGTRIVGRLGGLRTHLPALAVLTALAAASMGGVIPWFGFVAKETLLDAFITNPLALAVIVVSAALTVAVALILFWDVFMRPEQEHLHIHKPQPGLLMGPGLLVGAGSVLGLLLPVAIIPLITPAVPKEFKLVLFPGFNTAFILSTIAVLAGVGIFAVRRLIIDADLPKLLPTGEEAYQAVIGAVEWSADMLLRTQNGRVRSYLMIILGSFIILMIASGSLFVALDPATWFPLELSSTAILELLLLLLAIGGAVGAIITREHLTAALAMGVMGYAIGGIFLLAQAPDVALVQFLVETLATVLIILMIGRIPTAKRREAAEQTSSTVGVWRDISISTGLGVVVALFALAAVTSPPAAAPIAEWHLENALPLTGVTDVVSAILADFRATDTLLEITVFGMAALGIVTLLSVGRTSSGDAIFDQLSSSISTPFTRKVADLVMPFSLVIAVSHVLYGGSAPGDGFTAGTIGGLGIALWHVVYGYEEARKRLAWLRSGWIMTTGLALALGNALLPLLFGGAFFSITKATGFTAPAGLHIASTLVFELSIFLAVSGGVGLIMQSIARPVEFESDLQTREEGESVEAPPVPSIEEIPV